MLENLFKLSQHKTSVRTEILAGVATFLTMAYIIVVNHEKCCTTAAAVAAAATVPAEGNPSTLGFQACRRARISFILFTRLFPTDNAATFAFCCVILIFFYKITYTPTYSGLVRFYSFNAFPRTRRLNVFPKSNY